MDTICRAFVLAILPLLVMPVTPIGGETQSLADLSQREADRREALKRQGIEGKVIEGEAVLAPNGNITTFTPSAAPAQKPSRQSAPKTNAASLRSYRTALQKLDRAIEKEQGKLDLLRARMQAEKWALPKTGRASSRGNNTEDSQKRMQNEINELQMKIKQLRRERFETYETGKKAGFLPGELDGKGIVP